MLIIKQPDYGTALAYIFAFVAILYVAGLRKRYIFLGVILRWFRGIFNI